MRRRTVVFHRTAASKPKARLIPADRPIDEAALVWPRSLWHVLHLYAQKGSSGSMSRATSSRLAQPAIALSLAAAVVWLVVMAARNLSAASSDFMPHGYCYLWNPHILWLNVISDGLITLSYYAIPAILDLLHFQESRRSLQSHFLDVRHLHSGLRHHALDGNLERLARQLRASGCHQGHNRCGVGAYGCDADPVGTEGDVAARTGCICRMRTAS